MAKAEVKFEGAIIHGKDGERKLTPGTFESLSAEALALSIQNKGASCWQWMKELKIGYGEAVIIMDYFEMKGIVRPIKSNKEGFPESSGPRKLYGV